MNISGGKLYSRLDGKCTKIREGREKEELFNITLNGCVSKLQGKLI